ncbi:hypothetical protein HYH03_012207 [Edaphochlamys debaryana]|uniref:Uncharacterized protein n=1 Tax=Edaphochlamys debaryana TaxID=47281 RepID=A0A835XQR2_9CHLO|nr:hypothetical protein HYH03_012207 [Edaphochlamys debaryana]|eukprot:KAG2489377.1 hypothetical protein HYH03_012207 [Edaphochlamys debaryana]
MKTRDQAQAMKAQGPAGASGAGGGDGGEPAAPSRYPPWLRVWLIACGALYALALRPRLFAEREELRKHVEKEAAAYQKYEEDWDSLVAAHSARQAEAAEQRGAGAARKGRAGGSQGRGAGTPPPPAPPGTATA